mgnify:FL=1|jgi:hypothetical protein
MDMSCHYCPSDIPLYMNDMEAFVCSACGAIGEYIITYNYEDISETWNKYCYGRASIASLLSRLNVEDDRADIIRNILRCLYAELPKYLSFAKIKHSMPNLMFLTRQIARVCSWQDIVDKTVVASFATRRKCIAKTRPFLQYIRDVRSSESEFWNAMIDSLYIEIQIRRVRPAK